MILNLGGGAAAPKLTSIAVTTQPTKTTYDTGESFNKSGMVVTAYFDDGSSSVVTGYTCSPTTVPFGKSNVTVSYTHEGITKQTTVAVVAHLYLYKAGNQCTSVTGGWTGSLLTKNSTTMTFGGTISANSNYYCRTTNGILVQNKKTLIFEVSVDTGKHPYISYLRVSLANKTSPSTTASNYAAYTNLPVEDYETLSRTAISVNTSSVDGTVYPLIYIRNGNSTYDQTLKMTIYNVYFKGDA